MLKDAIYTYLPILTKIINWTEWVFKYSESGRCSFIFLRNKTLFINKINKITGVGRLPSHMSKDFGRLLYKQMEGLMNKKLSFKLCGFRKNYNT